MTQGKCHPGMAFLFSTWEMVASKRKIILCCRLFLAFSFLAMVLRSGSDKGLQSQGAGRRQKHRRKAFLHFHSTAIAVKITRGEGRAKKLRIWSYRTKTLEWFLCRQLVEIKSFWLCMATLEWQTLNFQPSPDWIKKKNKLFKAIDQGVLMRVIIFWR